MASEYKIKDLTSLSLKPGDKQEVEVEGIEGGKVVLVNAGGKIQAVGSKCTHYGAPLAKGVLTSDGRLTCPWHGACFNAKTGDVEDAPALDAIPVFNLTERDGGVFLTGAEADIKSSRRKPSNFQCKATTPDKVVVVGGGSSTMGVVEGLREKGFRGTITVITKEGYLPIDRTKLSKALIADQQKIAWRDQAWFDSGSVEWVFDEVKDVNVSDRTVSTADGKKFPYTKLVLATGGTPRVLPLQGFKVLGNIFTLRTIHDTKKITSAIGENKGKRIVIVGSSFIGMEVAIASSEGNDVTVVGQDKTPLEKVLGGEIGAGIQKAVEGKGVKFHMEAGVDKAEPSTSDPSLVGSVLLKDGTRLEADLVILGVGVAPATEFLRGNDAFTLEEDGSLKTNEHWLVQGKEDIYALGDIATFPYHGPGGEGRHTRIEHWNVAQNSGRAAAEHIAAQAQGKGLGERKQFIPVFWSALGAQLRYCGSTLAGWDDVVIQGNPGELKFAAFYTHGEMVVAMASMGMDPIMTQTTQLMRLGKMPSKSQLQNGYDILKIGVPA